MCREAKAGRCNSLGAVARLPGAASRGVWKRRERGLDGSSDECDALPRRWTVHNAWKHATVARQVQSQQCTHRQTELVHELPVWSCEGGEAAAAGARGSCVIGCRLRSCSRSERRASGALRAGEYGDELYEAEARRRVDAVHECCLCFVRAARLATWARRQAALLYCYAGSQPDA